MHPHLAHIGAVTIPTYGVIAAAGLVLAILLAARCARVLHISEDAIWNLCTATAAGTLILSRLVIIAQVPQSFLHYPLYILTLPTVTRFGLLAAILCGLAYALLRQLPLLLTADALAPAALLFTASLHFGAIFSGDDLGLATVSRLGTLVPGDDGHHPVALYAALLTLAAAAITLLYLPRQSQPGETFGLALTLAAVTRFIADEFRPGYVLPDTVVANFLRIDQLLLILLAAAGALFFLQRKPAQPHRSGQVNAYAQ